MKLIKLLNEGKSLYVFDFDDTLVKSDAWIYVKHKDSTISKLNPGEYAKYEPQQDDVFDFKDFNTLLKNPKLIKKNINKLKKYLISAQKSTDTRVTILTARKLGYPIKHFFKTIGIDPYIVALNNSSPQKKADWIENKIISGYKKIFFIDDSNKNINAVKKLQIKYPEVQIIPILAE